MQPVANHSRDGRTNHSDLFSKCSLGKELDFLVGDQQHFDRDLDLCQAITSRGQRQELLGKVLPMFMLLLRKQSLEKSNWAELLAKLDIPPSTFSEHKHLAMLMIRYPRLSYRMLGIGSYNLLVFLRWTDKCKRFQRHLGEMNEQMLQPFAQALTLPQWLAQFRALGK